MNHPARTAAEADYWVRYCQLERDVRLAETALTAARNSLYQHEANKAHFIAYRKATKP